MSIRCLGISSSGRIFKALFILCGILQLSGLALAEQPSIFINAGGSNHTDTANNQWESDANYISTGKIFSRLSYGITGTEDDPLYQTERYTTGNMIWKILLENGNYNVRLHFAEIWFGDPNKRIFDVLMEGEMAFEDVDIFAQAGGKFIALVLNKTIEVTDGELDIEFKKQLENPKISAIEIHPVIDQDVPTAQPSSAPTAQPSSAQSESPPTSEAEPNEFTPIYINAGGVTFTDIAQNTWVSDDETLGKYYNTGKKAGTTKVIDKTLDDQLYQSERWDPPTPDPPMQYDIPVDEGYYDLFLHFAETYSRAQSNGARVFDVWVEGELVLDDLDIFEKVGGYTALVESVLGVHVTDGNLTIMFDHVIENPKISGIEVHASSQGASQEGPTEEPAASQWIDLNESEDYEARHECSFVQAGDKFYMFGGREEAQKLDIYDYATDTWTVGAEPPKEFNHFQATLYEGLIWVIGAFEDNIFPNEVPEKNVHVYDPAKDVWMVGPEIPWPRGGGGLVVFEDEFYLVGGNTVGHNGGFVPWLDKYSPDTGKWVSLADAPHSRDHFHAAVANDKLYAIGGRRSVKVQGSPSSLFEDTVAEVDVFDFATNEWMTSGLPADLPTPRAASGVAVFDGKIMIMGGESVEQDAYNRVDGLDVATGTWSSMMPMNHRRHGTQAIVSGDGVFIAGGSPNRGGGNQHNMEVYNKNEPQGAPSIPGELSAPIMAEIVIRQPGTVSIEHSGGEGKQGIFVNDAVIIGPNASNFTITNEVTGGLLIRNGGKLDYVIEFRGDLRDLRQGLPDQTATLQVTHSKVETINVNLVGKLQYSS